VSINIDSWKTIKLDNLSIPMNIVEQFAGEDIRYGKPPAMRVFFGEYVGINGELIGGTFHVKEIEIAGTGSGYYQDALDQMFKASAGTLTAFLIWEGQWFTLLIVENGKIERRDIQIEELVTAYLNAQTR
jgi:hypothetical protein